MFEIPACMMLAFFFGFVFRGWLDAKISLHRVRKTTREHVKCYTSGEALRMARIAWPRAMSWSVSPVDLGVWRIEPSYRQS